eukprot:5839026-Amphidinium_carterae.1
MDPVGLLRTCFGNAKRVARQLERSIHCIHQPCKLDALHCQGNLVRWWRAFLTKCTKSLRKFSLFRMNITSANLPPTAHNTDIPFGSNVSVCAHLERSSSNTTQSLADQGSHQKQND